MDVFISWSGDRSKAVAKLMRTWLPQVLQEVKPHYSDHDVDRGSVWFTDILQLIRNSRVLIACVTRENQSSPWVLFESGVCVRDSPRTIVIPLLIDVGRKDVEGPFVQLNMVETDREGVYGLVKTLYDLVKAESGTEGLPPWDLVNGRFEGLFGQFETGLEDAKKAAAKNANRSKRTPEQIAGETLNTVRSLDRRIQTIESHMRGLKPGRIPWEAIIAERTSDWEEMEYELRFIVSRLCAGGVSCRELDELLTRHEVYPEGMIESTFINYSEPYWSKQRAAEDKEAAAPAPQQDDDEPKGD